jgi:hypothetical protein
MPREKDDRRILSAVDLPDQWSQAPMETNSRARGFTTFGPGDEDALEEAMTQQQQEYLLSQGAIEGTWAAKGTLPEGVKNEGPPRRLAGARKAADIRTQQEAARKAEEEARRKALEGNPEAGGPPPAESDAQRRERERREVEERDRQRQAAESERQRQQAEAEQQAQRKKK